MTKFFAFLFILAFSLSTFAQECATNLSQLESMLEADGNQYSTRWEEVNRNPLILRISNGNGNLNLRFTKAGGDWATVSARVCKNGSRYVAQIQNVIWGDAAPSMVKGQSIRQIPLSFQGPNLRVSISLWRGNFSAR